MALDNCTSSTSLTPRVMSTSATRCIFPSLCSCIHTANAAGHKRAAGLSQSSRLPRRCARCRCQSRCAGSDSGQLPCSNLHWRRGSASCQQNRSSARRRRARAGAAEHAVRHPTQCCHSRVCKVWPRCFQGTAPTPNKYTVYLYYFDVFPRYWTQLSTRYRRHRRPQQERLSRLCCSTCGTMTTRQVR